MPSNKNPRKKFKNILNILTDYFKGARYKMLSKEEDLWLD
jgi:hypothetical protein